MVVAARGHGEPVAIDPTRSLVLLSVAHAVNHAQAALLPLIYLAVIAQFGIGVPEIAFLASAGALLSGLVQLTFSGLTRRFSRRVLLGWGNLVFGGFMALQAVASTYLPFAAANIVSRIGGAPQHPVGNALLAEQYPPERRGFAISTHIAGGNIGTVAVPLVGAALIAGVGWQWTVVLFGLPAVVVGLAMFAWIRESGADRAAAIAQGSLRDSLTAVARDRELLLTFLSSTLGGGARGLGVLNLFVPLYLSLVLGFDATTVATMLTVLLLGSVPGPIVAGWLSDRLGRKPLIVGVYVGGAVALAAFVIAGRDPLMLWISIIFLSVFNFVESPQLQALLADISRPAIRDASFAVYFTIAFATGAVWTAIYGGIIAILGNAAGLPVVFWLMAATFVLAALSVLPIRAEQRTAEVRAEERALGLAHATAILAADESEPGEI